MTKTKEQNPAYRDEFLPRIVYQMVVHGAYIVGSAAKKLTGEDVGELGDFDLLVPLHKWQTVALLIPSDASPNRFGGWRFTTFNRHGEDVEVDVWPDDPMNYLHNCKSTRGGRVVVLDFISNAAYYKEFVEV